MSMTAAPSMKASDSRKLLKGRRLVAAVLVLAGVAMAWYSRLLQRSPRASENALLIIAPYRYHGTWVFDDDRVGLVREPFVAGIPEMIDVLVKEIPNAEAGFRLTFSARPFPGYQKKLTWIRGEMEGNYYRLDDPPMEGWLCPALLKYYDKPPKELYVKAEPKG